MQKINKDLVDAIFEYSVDRKNRNIYLFGDIESEEISQVVKAIYLLSSEDNTKAIEIFISSFGGDMYEMLGLYDVLNTVDCPITTVTLGKCQSAAVLIAAAGRPGNRWAGENTWFMLHNSITGEDELGCTNEAELGCELDHHVKLNKQWFELLAKNSNRDYKFWRKFCTKAGNQYFSAEDAIEYGLVDNLWNQKEGT